jgi:quinol-cytochrome oxidoreductase complex cytochrome b subunit
VNRAIRVALWAGLALLAVLAVTGFWLSFEYRPSATAVRSVHVGASRAFIVLSITTCGLVIVRQFEERSSWLAPVGAAVGTLVALFASFTGYLLPWDQLALRAVTIGSHYEGMWKAAFSDQIRFVLVGSSEISQATLRNWFLVHAFVLPLALFASVLVLNRRGLSDDSAQELD